MSFDRTSLVTSAIMMGIELLFGVGVVGGVALFVAAICFVTYLLDRKNFSGSMRAALPFALVGLLTISWVSINSRVAVRKAGPVITACEDFQRRNGRYPKSLDQLVPEFLPSVPLARWTLLGNRFGYSEDPPSLYFAAMFHGVVTYDFRSHKWWTND
jgi:hypothetical protein